ncbi:hypothetical protein PV327_001979 [Microctonus hyperodae]|uniref:Bee-milk protein n=1 Tax=Microctonus hyperodae TaxID=165561 RepID=A0AA39FEX9_MICHY|nr:hypothetical protein PV327_001979 [Microctonus hyperodae]
MSLTYLAFLLHFCFVSVISNGKLQTVYKWSWIDYLWENESHRITAILSGDYNYTKPVIIDVDIWKDGKTFVTVIRSQGVPASLTTISGYSGRGGPLLEPYPNWSWAQKGNCEAITSVYRVAIDECDRLWVLDTGKIDDVRVCPAQLLAFNLYTDQLITRVKIPQHIAESDWLMRGLLVTPIVETQGHDCKQTYVYIADVTGNGLIIFNGTSLWRLESPLFAPQEIAAHVTIANDTFHLDDGVLGMALSPKLFDGTRFLMFRPLASYDMTSVDTSNLQESYDGSAIRYTLASRILPSQSAAMAFSAGGTLFFGLTQDLGMACWHINNPINRKNIEIIDNYSDYQFVSGMKVISPQITNTGKEELWISINKYQNIILGKQNFDEINFRIMMSTVDELIDDTNCNPRPRLKFLQGYDFYF